jgi:uncharacterized membrane protein
MKVPEFPRRDSLPDLLKGWAVIWMILVHSIELFLSDIYSADPLARFGYFMGAVPAAPVFMFLMGFYLLKPGLTLRKMVLRGLKLLTWGLLLNIGLNLSLILRWLNNTVDVPILRYVFGVDILLFAGLAVIIAGVLQILRPPWYLWILLAFLTPTLNYFIHPDPSAFDGITEPDSNVYLTAFLYGSAPWSYFPLIPWLSYVFAGIGLSLLLKSQPQLGSKTRYHLFAAIPALVIVALNPGKSWQLTQDLNAYYHHETIFFVWALSFILILIILIKGTLYWKESLVMKWIRFLGVRVTSVYVIQWLIIGNLGTWLYKAQNSLETIVLFTFVLAATTVCSLLYFKFKTHEKDL